MDPLFVLPPNREVNQPHTVKQFGTPAARAAAEQAFYDEHGSQGAVRLSKLLEWIGQRLVGRRAHHKPDNPDQSPADTAPEAAA